MRLSKDDIFEFNQTMVVSHRENFDFLSEKLTSKGVDVESLLQRIEDFQVAIPSWALGTGGTRFGRFGGAGEPRNLEEKIEDVGLLHALNGSSGAISLHIPWDIPQDHMAIRQLAREHNLLFDAVNSNTFQDQDEQRFSYKYGSLQHVDAHVRDQAIEHNQLVVEHGKALGSKALTVWLSDGSCFPGQIDFRQAFENTLDSLHQIYESLPDDWRIFVEYKAFEPNFYSMTVGDWGQSLLLANKLGPKAFTLVDLGHHLPNANIEQIVALLMMEGKLGGFHFNDSKYGDDDLTVGSIKPYQLFLIFNELVTGMDRDGVQHDRGLAWMIDASHNVKDPLEDLLQSVDAILVAYAQSLIVDQRALTESRVVSDVAQCQEILQDAYRTDVRPLVRQALMQSGACLDPLSLFRKKEVRSHLIAHRGNQTIATGL